MKKTKLNSRIVRDSANLMRRKMFVKHCDDLNPIEPKILNRMMTQVSLLDDLTNHWSGKLPNLYSSVDKLRRAIAHGDLTMAHGFTVKVENELKSAAKLYDRPIHLKYGLVLVRRIRALLAKAGF